MILMTDMGTFTCPSQCEDLCKKVENKDFLGTVIYYPGLTPDEKKLVEKYPKEALIVFIQKIRAEQSSERNFPDQGLSDESDAFRHYIWAGLLMKELGTKRAKEFLNAHEEDPGQPKNEKDMDTYNNERGLLTAEKLIKENKWSLDEFEKRGLDDLREKNLKVLRPGLVIPKEPQ